MHRMGFEPMRANTVGLKSTSLDHSDTDAIKQCSFVDQNLYKAMVAYDLKRFGHPVRHDDLPHNTFCWYS